MKMYHGQKMLIINEPLNKPKENIVERLQMFKAPKPILSIKTWAEEFVNNWYQKPHPEKLTTQTQEEESIPPAPPVIREGEE